MSQCVEGYCHLNASSSRRTWHGHDHPSLDPLRTSDGQRQRLSITPPFAPEVVFVPGVVLPRPGCRCPRKNVKALGAAMKRCNGVLLMPLLVTCAPAPPLGSNACWPQMTDFAPAPHVGRASATNPLGAATLRRVPSRPGIVVSEAHGDSHVSVGFDQGLHIKLPSWPRRIARHVVRVPDISMNGSLLDLDVATGLDVQHRSCSEGQRDMRVKNQSEMLVARPQSADPWSLG